jgi:hypothetical protein
MRGAATGCYIDVDNDVAIVPVTPTAHERKTIKEKTA